MTSYLDARRRRRHKLRNRLHSALLVGGMGGLMALCAWLLWGGGGVVWIGVGVAIVLAISPAIPPEMVMRLYRARRLDGATAPNLIAVLEELAGRAELARVPRLFYIPSTTINAFAIGRAEDAAIAVTDGLLRRLDMGEAVGVLAHEISHIRNNDLRTMQLADTISRMTTFMSYLGMFLFVIYLPVELMGGDGLPWLAVIVLWLAPSAGSLLQLALSRAREYDADLDAAALTGDPAGMARALDKLERYQGRFWEEMLLPGRRIPEPSLLRTHPSTKERIKRLLELTPSARTAPLVYGAPRQPFDPVRRRPRHRWSGLWY